MSGDHAAAFAAAAAVLAGTPFRLHGRDPATGVDCVGLVARALSDCGWSVRAPEGYALRSLDVTPLLRFATDNGFAPTPAASTIAPGDLILFRISPIQAHLAVALGATAFVHAHAGLGRVTIERRAPAWPIAARWRLDNQGPT